MNVKLPILRGFTEIQEIYKIATANDSTICGGYARYCASTRKEPVKAMDVDLFPNIEGAENKNLEAFRAMGYTVKHENENSISLKNPKEGKLQHTPTVQIIKPRNKGRMLTLGTVEEILTNFDFTVVKAAIVSPDEVLADESFAEDELHQILVFRNIHCPISSLLRAMKYARKGYFMRPFEAMKLFKDWMDRGEEYRQQLYTYFSKSVAGEMTQQEIDELEALLHID